MTYEDGYKVGLTDGMVGADSDRIWLDKYPREYVSGYRAGYRASAQYHFDRDISDGLRGEKEAQEDEA